MQQRVIHPQVEPPAYPATGAAPWGYARHEPQPMQSPVDHLGQVYAELQQSVWPMLADGPMAYLQAPTPMPAPPMAPVHPALVPRGGFTRSHSRRDGVFTLAVTLMVLMIALAAAVAFEGGLVRHDTPAPSSTAPTVAVAAPAVAAVAPPAPVATAAPAVG